MLNRLSSPRKPRRRRAHEAKHHEATITALDAAAHTRRELARLVNEAARAQIGREGYPSCGRFVQARAAVDPTCQTCGRVFYPDQQPLARG